MRRPTQMLVPFLLSIGPLWLLLFANQTSWLLKTAGIIGTLGFSLGLILMLSMIHSLQRKVEMLEGTSQEKMTSEK